MLVLDMFTAFDGGDRRALRRSGMTLVPVIAELIARARRAGAPVIYVDDHQGRWTANREELVASSQRGLWPSVDPIVPLASEPFVVRVHPSAFDRSLLEDLLHAHGVRRLILTGQVAEQGILYSALDASVRGFQVVVAKDAVGTIDRPLGDAALRMMERNMCVQVTSAEQLDFAPMAPASIPRRPLPDPDGAPEPTLPKARATADHPPSSKRQRLLRALATVIAREGFGGTKVADVAREARISLRTFYGEFSSKDECFLALHEQIALAVVDAVRTSVVFDRAWIEVVRAGFQTAFELALAQPRLTEAILCELGSLGPEARQAREEAADLFAATLIELVEAGRQAAPELAARPLTPMVARGMVGAITELVVSHFGRTDTELLSELVDTATEMLSNALHVNFTAGAAVR